jgi:DNA/RNA-binding domain of Phe-tRNA-synthetase-like protein
MSGVNGPDEVSFQLAAELRDTVRVGWIRAEPVSVRPAAAPLLEETEHLRRSLRERLAGRPPGSIEELQAARRLYKDFGIDPTKTRPSSEALLRRVLRDLPVPRIVNAVDVGNLLSLQFLLPIGLYDAEKIDPPVLLRRGDAGESYPGIRKESVHLAGRPVLEDRRGPFGNPTSDSLRTAVDASTRSLWMVIFAPRGYRRDILLKHVAATRATMERHLAPADALTRTSGAVPDL